jgi:hypothetical protein
VPIIPKATKYHGTDLLAVKKESVVAPFEVFIEININMLKYKSKIPSAIKGVIYQKKVLIF